MLRNLRLLKTLNYSTGFLSTKLNMSSACIVVIGSEVLNGKITDTNSAYFAKFCFNLGIALKEIVTVRDHREDIIEAVNRVANKYDFVVTSGGIGPTHDDITYECVAKSFGLDTEINNEVKERMKRFSNPEGRFTERALKDYYRMATLPTGNGVKNHYVLDDMWVPVCSINGKVYILPGVPQLFERLLEAMVPILKENYKKKLEPSRSFKRYFVKTTRSEAEIASILRELQDRAIEVSPDIEIGSYPHFGMGFNTVSVCGNADYDDYLKMLASQVAKSTGGVEITEDEENAYTQKRQ
ncbi:HER120Wp [Eremothecium sinecaudum]|uniref:HER120Wp n=1 Tax=Eremothecium sinecaudum TaxID=45286 RepID=A0A0X8HTZ0_9SACH|nr:HER120Wp [Eremothecium sinecaudum]AMD21399.1 HER120Wp [Eremothecium sinecaudum]